MLRISLNCPPCCRCGGSLVNSWYVVTAGHCVARARASQVRVTLGEYVLKSDVEPLPGRTYGASLIKVHPYFKFTPQADRYDVAVIRYRQWVMVRKEDIENVSLLPLYFRLSNLR